MGSFSERRSQNRYPVNHLSVTIKSLQHHHHEWDNRSVNAIDFNRYGIALETEQNLAIGDTLTMRIGTDDVSVAEINGLVCNRTQLGHGFRFGIRFEYDCNENVEGAGVRLDIGDEILCIERQAKALDH